MLKVVFFDAVGTLIYLPRSVGDHYRDVAVRFGMDLDAALLTKAFVSAWAVSPPRTGGRQPRPDDDKGWWRDLVARVIAAAVSPEQKANFDSDGYFEAVYAHFAMPGVWAVYPEAYETLSELRARGYSLAVISNFDRRLYAVLSHLRLNVFFERFVISSEVGADKPDPFIFQFALQAMQVTPAQAIHVGDDPRCDGGAEAVGMRVLRLERPQVTLRDLIPMIELCQSH